MQIEWRQTWQYLAKNGTIVTINTLLISEKRNYNEDEDIKAELKKGDIVEIIENGLDY